MANRFLVFHIKRSHGQLPTPAADNPIRKPLWSWRTLGTESSGKRIPVSFLTYTRQVPRPSCAKNWRWNQAPCDWFISNLIESPFLLPLRKDFVAPGSHIQIVSIDFYSLGQLVNKRMFTWAQVLMLWEVTWSPWWQQSGNWAGSMHKVDILDKDMNHNYPEIQVSQNGPY